MRAEFGQDVKEFMRFGSLAFNYIFIFSEFIIPLTLDNLTIQDTTLDIGGEQPIIEHLLTAMHCNYYITVTDACAHLTQDFVIHRRNLLPLVIASYRSLPEAAIKRPVLHRL
jgi:hypothetical protein